VAWIVRLVKTGADGERQCADVLTINRPDELDDIANLGLTLAEGKLLLAGLQQEIVAAQAKGHAARRPDCRSCGEVCRVKDYRDHAVATLFGQVTVRLPRFRCAGCGGNEAGHGWPSYCRSTPELDQLQAHLSALMTYRVAADVLRQMFGVVQKGHVLGNTDNRGFDRPVRAVLARRWMEAGRSEQRLLRSTQES
jgi:hypothetical protein